MNSAWAETDTYKFIRKLEADDEDNERLKMYVGYVEGPPPYFLNPHSLNYPADPYTNNSGDHISEVTFVETDGSSTDKKLEYTVGLKIQFKIFGSKTEVSEEFGQAFTSVNELEVSKEYTWFPIKPSSPSENNSKGQYIVCKPKIHRADYKVTDVFGQDLYKTYYFYNTGISETVEPADLKGGLVAGNLETYFERPINWEGYDQYGNGDNSLTWYPGHEEAVSIKVTTINSKSLTSKTELTIGGGIGEIFEIEGSGSFVYETSSTVSSGFEVKCTTPLNEPDADGIPDLTHLEYNLYWLLPSSDTSINWWVPDGLLQNQSPWCVTYDVTHYEFSDGKSFGAAHPDSPKSGQNTDQKSVTNTSLTHNALSDQGNPFLTLTQNMPNPFSSSTVFRYHLGSGSIGNEKSSVLKHVVMTVFDMNGTKVATLVDEQQVPGDYQIDWNPSGLKSGFYFCSLIADGQRRVIKLLKMD